MQQALQAALCRQNELMTSESEGERRLESPIPWCLAAVLGAFATLIAGLAYVPQIHRFLGLMGFGSEPWKEEAATGFVIAFAVMLPAALAPSGWPRRITAAVIFFVGATLAWLAWHAAYASPYGGMAQMVWAYAGGGLGLALSLKPWRTPKSEGLFDGAVLALPLLALCVAALLGVGRPQFGQFAYLYNAKGDTLRAMMVRFRVDTLAPPVDAIVLSEKKAAIVRLSAGKDRFVVETDIGSGASAWVGEEMKRAGILLAVERAADVGLAERLASEIAAGQTASIFSRFPLPHADFSDAALFRSEPMIPVVANVDRPPRAAKPDR